jgi:hypothetical protein
MLLAGDLGGAANMLGVWLVTLTRLRLALNDPAAIYGFFSPVYCTGLSTSSAAGSTGRIGMYCASERRSSLLGGRMGWDVQGVCEPAGESWWP